MRASLVILIAVTLLCAACDPVASRSIYLHRAASAGVSGSGAIAIASLPHSDVSSALAIVERVVTSRGLHRQPWSSEPGLVAVYQGEHKADGSTPTCFVYRHPENDTLEVRFDEWARFSSSDIVRSLDQEVYAALLSRFGSDRITRKA